jgi:pimeloyl-ACP methyl ester carboxylesterase
MRPGGGMRDGVAKRAQDAGGGSPIVSLSDAVCGVEGSDVAVVNGVRIGFTAAGRGAEPLVLVHGSWGSRHSWDAVVPGLAESFRVISYDRRGHSESERLPGQGSFSEDVADAAALIEQLGLAPAWVAGNSAGAVITIQLAASRPELLRGIAVHEPPAWSLLAGGTHAAQMYAEVAQGPMGEVLRRIDSGDHAGAAELFVERIAFGPGTWGRLPAELRRTFVDNAPTFVDEERDPGSRTVDEPALRGFTGPVLITAGDQSPPWFGAVVERLAESLPHAVTRTYHGAGHVPHVTHPERYVASLQAFIRAASEARR